MSNQQERYKIEQWRDGGSIVRDYEDSKAIIGGFGIPHHQAELICEALNQAPKGITISRDDLKMCIRAVGTMSFHAIEYDELLDRLKATLQHAGEQSK